MSAAALTLGDAALMIRQALKDRSYRATPLGLEVARYYRWKKNEWGASPDTMRDYETTLARTALFSADLELRDFTPPIGTERLRECWDHYWGDKAAGTRAKVRSTWIDFFEWAVRERGLIGNPARALAAPRLGERQVETFPPSLVEAIITAQTYAADSVGCALILKYGLRKGGVMAVQRRHFDFERRLLTVRTKGRRVYPLPITDAWIWRRLGELDLDGWKDDHWLLYTQATRKRRVPVDEAEEILNIRGEKIGYAHVTKRDHSKKPSRGRTHDWWYRCLQRAGLVPEGVTKGMHMHRGRHTAATELQRSQHDLRLTQLLLGHKDIRSTAKYAQMDTSDLAAALRRMENEAE